MKHTPGPWKFGESTRFTNNGVRTMPLIPIIQADGDPFLFEVALVWDLNDERTQSNARLIAAAPELLAACEAMRVFSPRNWPPGPDMHAETEACELRDAALAKARDHETED